MDQLTLGERVGARHFEKPIEIEDRINVGGQRTSHYYSCGDTQREPNRHAGETQLHDGVVISFCIVAHGLAAVNG
ncbi:MAG: hypothetical protein WB341_11055 [Terracidiphilus sp.]